MYATTCQFHTTKAGTKLLFELHSPQFPVSTAECRMQPLCYNNNKCRKYLRAHNFKCIYIAYCLASREHMLPTLYSCYVQLQITSRNSSSFCFCNYIRNVFLTYDYSCICGNCNILYVYAASAPVLSYTNYIRASRTAMADNEERRDCIQHIYAECEELWHILVCH